MEVPAIITSPQIPSLYRQDDTEMTRHTYTRLVNNAGRIALVREGVSPFSKDFYHAFIDLTWWKLMLVSLAFYVSTIVLFGLLYYASGGVYVSKANSQMKANFMECFWFSVQTEDTIGYGVLHPVSHLSNIVACTQSYSNLLFSAIQYGIVFAKISRPSRLKHNFVHSSVALVTEKEPSFFMDPNESPDSGIGEYKAGRRCLVFRFVNARLSVLCEPKFTLLCACPDSQTDAFVTTHELAFELNRQKGRARFMDLSKPYLGLPWQVVHPIDENSPLFGKSAADLAAMRVEIIAVVDGIDEVVSDNVQVKWSYLASDLIWDANRFTPMVFTGVPDDEADEIEAMGESTPLLNQTEDRHPNITSDVPASEQAYIVDVALISQYEKS
ncbi:hypothetical protein SARC_05188 [Sphaeroforma arctica JP610]|uniref:Inward rectifier potassium channel C-terminal domain-containing protein n=1 Tax=Sphaeroforma arctica JP610 TaxID=667725 RepID=A0A0L0G0E3_9EUKA|nr:hypothetical protein SARC_05188 [Sphaeroforma arctica JP610]KNC82540.1 hypothetical protein SARC_05188 [Sphaeroforma arctica JP610]|eukprot:XP_014156442.1 hypothetical protein SARC_05188 [Sphaeroforma arctica JP610]